MVFGRLKCLLMNFDLEIPEVMNSLALRVAYTG